MSLLHRRCVQLELRGVCGSTSCSATTHFRCGLVQVEPRLDLPCLTSSHTLTKSLSAARSSQLRRVLRSTGCWCGGRGCWASPVACEFKMRLKQMVLLLSGLERLPARPLHGQRAMLSYSSPRLSSPLLTVGGEEASHGVECVVGRFCTV